MRILVGKYGVDVNGTNSEGLTPLCAAIDIYKNSRGSWYSNSEKTRKESPLLWVFLESGDLDVMPSFARAVSWGWTSLVMVLLLKRRREENESWDWWETVTTRWPPLNHLYLVLAVYLGWAPPKGLLERVRNKLKYFWFVLQKHFI
jgi:hypothetical protein